MSAASPASRAPRRRAVRVLIVDDSPFMLRRMTEILGAAGDLEIVGQARDGAEAIGRAASLKPDVITMDIQMPRMDGLVAIEHIMRTEPRPIVVVSSFVRRGSAGAIAALERGAVELVQKPSDHGIALDLQAIASELIGKVRVAARIRVVRTGGGPGRASAEKPPVRPDLRVADAPESDHDRPVAIGCSTGGPAALLQLCRRWRGLSLPPVLIAQHLPADFTAELARQMSEHLGGPVREAVCGDRAAAGEILLAPGGRQMTLDASGAVRLTAADATDRWVPSVDRLFQGLAGAHGRRALGVVLTGMGADGTAGAAAIRKAGGEIWAQDEASSIIDGMPRSVREAGFATRVMSLLEIGEALVRRADAPLAR